jgi:hypothetical protein
MMLWTFIRTLVRLLFGVLFVLFYPFLYLLYFLLFIREIGLIMKRLSALDPTLAVIWLMVPFVAMRA